MNVNHYFIESLTLLSSVRAEMKCEKSLVGLSLPVAVVEYRTTDATLLLLNQNSSQEVSVVVEQGESCYRLNPELGTIDRLSLR